MNVPCDVSCCYARKDKEYLLELKKHLASLERIGLITVRADIDISLRTEQRRESDYHIGDADIIILLISPDFVPADYFFNNEIHKAIERHRQGTACVIPLLIRPTYWQEAPFGGLPVLPKTGIPIEQWQNQDDAFVHTIDGIYTLVQHLKAHTSSNPWGQQVKEAPVVHSGGEGGIHATNTNTYNGPVINNSGGSIGVQHIGDQHITINGGTQKDGTLCLERGARALWEEDYSLAQEELRDAIKVLESDKPGKAAQACYFSALAFLGGMLPHTRGNKIMKPVEDHMKKAIRLYPFCASYYQILACIKKDMSEYIKALPGLEDEVKSLKSKGNSLPPCVDDEENMKYFLHCQPRLQIYLVP